MKYIFIIIEGFIKKIYIYRQKLKTKTDPELKIRDIEHITLPI